MSSVRSTFVIEREQCLCIFICGCLYFQTIADVFLRLIRMVFSETYKIDTMILYSIFVLCFLWGMPRIIRSVSLTHILIILFILVCVLVSWIINGDREGIYFTVLKNICMGCFPAFLAVASISDYTMLKKFLYKFSLLALSIEWVKIIFGAGLQTNGELLYSQQTGYVALTISVVCIMEWLKKRNLMSGLASVAGVGLVLVAGARGPLLALGLYVLCQIIKEIHARGKEKKIFAVVTIGVSLALFVIFNIRNLALFLQPIFLKLKLSPRLLYQIADANMFEDSSRIKLICYGIKNLLEKPLFGTGVLKDRYIMRDIMEPYGEAIGWYPHNIVLEVFMQFGLVLGLLLLISLVFLIGRTLKHDKNSDRKRLVLAFCGIGLFPLFISSSYIEYTEFYILLGLCSMFGERGHNEIS